MKIALYAGLVVVLVWFQVAFFGLVRAWGVMPNLLLVALVVMALWSEATPTLAAALLAGLLLDLVSGADFGLRTAFFAAICLAIIATRQLGLHAESVITAGVLVVIGTLLFNMAIIASLGAIPIDSGLVLQRIGIETAVNLLLLGVVLGARTLLQDRRSRVTTELRRGSWL
jgi:cell shape-determining protein MreD